MSSLLLNILLLASSAEAFWRMNCGIIQIGRIDPLVNPGTLAQHAHTISGGSNLGVSSNYQSLINSECTSCEISPDKSAYWTPNLYYARPNGSFEEVHHDGSVVYYLGRGLTPDGQKRYTPFPKGFQMLAGHKNSRRYNATGMTWGNATFKARPIADAVSYACLAAKPGPETPNIVDPARCIYGLRAQIHFQTCWDGKNLYKADQSHVAYLSQIDNGICPPGYPVLLPHLFMETLYAVTRVKNLDDGGRFVFSMGDPTGYGFHGDFQNGWDVALQKAAVEQCLDNGGFGTFEECPILNANRQAEFTRNCPIMPPQVDEPVRGVLDKLPGCIEITEGPEDAPNSKQECPESVPKAKISSTVDSVPRPTANPVIGADYGNDFNKYVGCANDTNGSPLRTLNAHSTRFNNGMTVKMCQSYCTSKGYRLSGVQFGTECYCDHDINPTAITHEGINMTRGCTITCPGDRTELCGGPGFINVYNNTDPNFIPFASFVNSVAALTSPVRPYGRNYLGCYSEGKSGRTLSGRMTTTDNMTVDTCQALCRDFQYYGTEFSNQCFCGNFISTDAAVQVLDTLPGPATSKCNMRCRGEASQVCGGSGVLNMWENTKYVPVAIKEVTANGYVAQRCLTDKGPGRALRGAATANANMTPDVCTAFCAEKNFKFAGVEYGRECYCGSALTTGPGFEPVDCPVEKLMTCAGNNKEYCGAGSLLNLYVAQ